MWFRNLQIYRFNQPFALKAEELAEKMAEFAFEPCGNHDSSRQGWVAPLGRHGSDLVHATAGYIMVCARKQQKILPAGAINELLEERLLQLEEREKRKPTSRERLALKEEITFELLPRALTRSTLLFAYIAPKEGLLVVNASSAKRAEELLTLLRETIGSVPVIPLATKNLPIQTMTHWLLHGTAPQGFTFGGECELRDLLEQSSVVTCRQQNLVSQEINSLVKEGMSVRKLSLAWNDRMECVIDDKLGIHKLLFSDLVQEQANSESADDAAARFDIDFSIMALELSAFILALLAAFGGEVTETK